VDRFAAFSVEAGVSVGCAGGGCRRSAMGLREAQPEKLTHSTQRTQSSRRKEEDGREESRQPRNPEEETKFAKHDFAKMDSNEILKGRPTS
jgi:hypothetical protein